MGWPSVPLPSHDPASDLSLSKDFCASDSAKAAVAVNSNSSEMAMRTGFIFNFSF